MIPNGSYTAVLDRFEDSTAVLELSSDTSDERYELVVEQSELPQPARHADAVLTIEVFESELADAEYKPAESTGRATEAQNRFDQLSNRPPDDDSS